MTLHSADAKLHVVAARQHGVVSRSQARAAGLSAGAVARRVRAGAWLPLSRRVLQAAGSAASFERSCWAGVLDAGGGAAVSHLTAAALYGLPGFGPGAVHVSRGRHGDEWRCVLATLHEPRLLPAHHLTVVPSGLPATTPARTLFDLAAVLHPLRLERAVDNALSRRVVELRGLRAVTIEMVARGRKGSTLMRELLSARGAGYIPHGSGLEATFHAAWIAAGNPPLDRQADSGGGHWVGRVDLRDPDVPLVIEIDGSLYHTALADVRADRRRDRELRDAGFAIERVTEEEIRTDVGDAVARVAAVRCSLLARKAARSSA